MCQLRRRLQPPYHQPLLPLEPARQLEKAPEAGPEPEMRLEVLALPHRSLPMRRHSQRRHLPHRLPRIPLARSG